MLKERGKHFLTWGDIKYYLLATDKVNFHFTDYNHITYPDLIPSDNDNARISTIYVGTSGQLNITFLDEYKGEKHNETW